MTCEGCEYLGRVFDHLANYQDTKEWRECKYPLPYFATPKSVSMEHEHKCEAKRDQGGPMAKVWIFRETGEVRLPKKGEWMKTWYGGMQVAQYDCETKQTILSLTILDHDPIREVWEKYKDISMADNSDVKEIFQAIRKYVEGK
jgi:hypothetical protein